MNLDRPAARKMLAWVVVTLCLAASSARAQTVNYRSIGKDTPPLYDTGDATTTNGSSIVTFGNGASLPADVGLGDKLTILAGGATKYYVLSRDSDTQVTIQGTAGATQTATYDIRRAFDTIAGWEAARTRIVRWLSPAPSSSSSWRASASVAGDHGDYDNDGDVDLFMPRNASGQRGYLWRNDGRVFVDVTVAAGSCPGRGCRRAGSGRLSPVTKRDPLIGHQT